MKRIVLITALLALTVVWGTHAQELVTLTTPIAKASIPSYAVDTILLDVRRSAIVVSLSAPTGDVLVKTYDGGTTPTGATLLHNLNTGNFSVNSLMKAVYNRLLTDGVITGTISGVPQ
jgi:hypothetical protein